MEIVVPSDKKKERLDKFLAAQLPAVTRAKLKRLIDDERVTIDGITTKAGFLIRPQQKIVIHFPFPEKTDIEPENIPLDIVYEDQFLMVLDKPAGLVVHPAYGNMKGTLVNALLAHCTSLSQVGGGSRPGLVHRLDKETSGLIVVAKDDVTHVNLSRQLSAHKMEREYRAIVWGHLKHKAGTVDAPLARHPKDRTRMHIDAAGKHAVTHYQVLDETSFASYLKLNLETGRTHQIRVHMMSINHPVFFDALYAGRGKQLDHLNPAQAQLVNRLFKKYKRQMLHARVLAFTHPATRELMIFESPLPTDMKEIIHILKSSNV
ncbi:MAG: RluA family pseudouridine synthase [Calditrichaeota bacterium]|nr:MAG: RluA family pseudouridine synthase [Calditrichota bacterium]